METMRHLAGTAVLGAVVATGGCSSMMPMDHTFMAKGGNCCCGMGAMTAEKPSTMGGMSMPAKPQGGGLLPRTEKSAAGPSCGDGGCGGMEGGCSCCGEMMKKS